MANPAQVEGDRLFTVASDHISPGRTKAGRALFAFATVLLFAVLAAQILQVRGTIDIGLTNWRPLLYAYLFWGTALGVRQVLVRGELGRRTLFVLPAVLFTVAMVVFPIAFGVSISFTNWNLSSLTGRQFNGLDNVRLHDDDATRLLDRLPAASLDRVDLLYPDPWPKRRHWKRRFVSPPSSRLRRPY